MRRLLVSVVSLCFVPSLAWAVCAGGTVVGASCGGVTAKGCCNWYGGDGFSEILQWCDNGTLCQRDCEAEGDMWDSLYCGYSSLAGKVTCGDLMDTSSYDDEYNYVECGSYTGGGTTGGDDLAGTGTGLPCGDIGYEGCCDGQTVTWCEGGELRIIDCSVETPSCGWSSEGYYDCGNSPTGDPSGAYPLSCDGSGGGTTGPSTSCGSVSFEGCCNGATVVWCESGALQQVNCAAEPDAPGPSCGWDNAEGYYWCGTSTGSDPSGAYPRACDGSGGSVGPCTPDCLGKLCGSDGCGGSCGPCGADQECVNGACIASQQCTPTCKRTDGTLKECGDNGCGGMCGSCGLGKVCSAAGACVDPGASGTCDPACGNRECGPDECDGVCGTCDAGKGCYEGFCVTGIACQPDCGGRECGPDGCEGTCGDCAAGSTCGTGGKCVAGTDSTPDDGVCPEGQFLYYGVCVSEDDEGATSRDPVNEAVDTDDGTGAKGGCALASRPADASALWLLATLLGLALVTRSRQRGRVVVPRS